MTRPLPAGAELFTKRGEQFAKWKPTKGRARTAKVTTGKDGSLRIVEESATYVAKFRDGSGVVREVSTGCRDEDAARSVLGKLERRAELVRSDVISSAEASTADHQGTPIADHFGAYLAHQQASGVSARHLADLERIGNRMFRECSIGTLRDVRTEAVELWLANQQAKKMSARTRNIHLQTLRGFCKWSTETARLASNPLARNVKANEQADRRRQRRARTEAELVKLLEVARWRPLAELGRETLAVDASEAEATGKRRKRSNWTFKPLMFEGLRQAVDRAREKLAEKPETIAELERVGRERALIYKTMVLTGLRKGELTSLTVGQLSLEGAMPFVELAAADEKNRQGSTIPLRGDLAQDLKLWLSDRPKPSTLRLRADQATLDSKRPLFVVPEALGKILDRDLLAAGIAKRDDRGRTIDVHALRHSFGTLLSKGGVSPRTAQAAMRHGSVDLTMNVYTDPKLLDVYGAMEALPTLNLTGSTTHQQNSMKATGTDAQDGMSHVRHSVSAVAPPVAPKVGQGGQSVAIADNGSENADLFSVRLATDENPAKQAKNPRQQGLRARVLLKSVLGESRTCNLRLRRPTLYPIELRERVRRRREPTVCNGKRRHHSVMSGFST